MMTTRKPWKMSRLYQANVVLESNSNWKAGVGKFRSFLVTILLTIVVQHSIYWSLSERKIDIKSESELDFKGKEIDSSNRQRRQTYHNASSNTKSIPRGNVCSEKFKRKIPSFMGKVTSDMEYWSFDKRRDCPRIDIDGVGKRKKHLKLSMQCNNISLIWTHVTGDIYVSEFGDDCVEKYISECCHGDNVVPNVVHYVWYLRGELSFVGFMSILSVIRFVNPCLIILHGDTVPYGRYWDFIVNISPNIIHLKRTRPRSVFGQRIGYNEHSGDIMRIEALLKYGGIYMDTDTVLVRPIDDLRQHRCVMSTQYRKLGSAFILAEKNATFLRKWLDGYQYKYNKFDYTYNAMTYPQILALKHSDLIHVEEGTVSRPKDMIGWKFYSRRYETYNWSKVYGIHLFTRLYGGRLNENTIRNLHSACGSILRHVLFGNKELCM